MESNKDSIKDVTMKSLDDRLIVIIEKLTEVVERLGLIIRLTSIGKQGVDIVFNPEIETDDLEKVCETMFPQPNMMQEKVSAIRRKLLEG